MKNLEEELEDVIKNYESIIKKIELKKSFPFNKNKVLESLKRRLELVKRANLTNKTK